jgi:hypothetical protein
MAGDLALAWGILEDGVGPGFCLVGVFAFSFIRQACVGT